MRLSRLDDAAWAILVVFLAGFYLAPSSAELWNRPHDLLYYRVAMPLLGLAAAASIARGARPRIQPLLSAALLLPLYLGITIAWPWRWLAREPELAIGEAIAHVAATASFVAGVALLQTRRRRRWLEAGIVAAAAIASLHAAASYATGTTYRGEGRLSSSLNFEHPNLFAQYLGAAVIVALCRHAEGGSGIWLAALTALAPSFALTEGRLAALALTGTLGFVVLAARERRGAGAAFLLLSLGWAAVAACSPTAAEQMIARGDAGRSFIYAELVRRVRLAPLLGLGLPARDDVVFPPGSPDFPGGTIVPHAHSALVGTLYFGGLVGVLLLAAVAGAALARGVRIARDERDPLPLALLAFGLACLLLDGHRIVSRPHTSSWLLFWLPIGLMATRRDAPHPARPGQPELDVPAMPPRSAWVAAPLALVLAQRLTHLGGSAVDGPHDWRQLDVLHAARAFAASGIDLLAPSVAWMGSHARIALDFPLFEAIVALLFDAWGEHIALARIVTLVASGIALLAFQRLAARLLASPAAGWLAVLLLAGTPLFTYYSRALLPDVLALALAMAATALWLAAVATPRPAAMLLAGALAVPATLVRPGILLPSLPLVVAAALGARPRRAGLLALSLAPALLACVLWQRHVEALNGAAPDWSVIPGYRKLTSPLASDVGAAAHRLQPAAWRRLGAAALDGSLGVGLVVPAAAGLGIALRRRDKLALAWAGGAFAHLLLFFSFHVRNDYAQLALLPPVALLAALAIAEIARPAWLAVLVAAAIACSGIAAAEARSYRREPLLEAAAAAVAAGTSSGDLVVITFGGLDCRSPLILVRANRRGWSIPVQGLRSELLATLAREGASHLALVTRWDPPDGVVGPRDLVAPELPDGHRLYLRRLPR